MMRKISGVLNKKFLMTLLLNLNWKETINFKKIPQ